MYYNQRRQQPARPQPTPEPVQNYSNQIKIIEDWIDSKKETENFDKLLAMYHNSSTLDQFKELLKQNDEDLLNELKCLMSFEQRYKRIATI
jgi:polyhydroxyalkanoate synthesis regulator protein